MAETRKENAAEETERRLGVSEIASDIPEPLREVMRQNSKNLEQVTSEFRGLKTEIAQTSESQT